MRKQNKKEQTKMNKKKKMKRRTNSNNKLIARFSLYTLAQPVSHAIVQKTRNSSLKLNLDLVIIDLEPNRVVPCRAELSRAMTQS